VSLSLEAPEVRMLLTGYTVMDLPPGYTLNSVSGNIVDNQWLGIPVTIPDPAVVPVFAPAASGIVMAGIGLVGWVTPRRRGSPTGSPHGDNLA
jgi:hypothetical protein